MKIRREFTGEVSEQDAVERMLKMLKQMKFREHRSPAGHFVFVRGKPKGGLFALRPRTFYTVCHAWVTGHGAESTTVIIEFDVQKIFQPPHRLAELLYEGELNDLESGILTNQPATINRAKQNKMAGTAHLAVLIAGLGITLGLSAIVGPLSQWEGAVAWVACYIGWYYFCGRLPLVLLEYELHHPRGAKIISDEPEPEVAPKPAKAKA